MIFVKSGLSGHDNIQDVHSHMLVSRLQTSRVEGYRCAIEVVAMSHAAAFCIVVGPLIAAMTAWSVWDGQTIAFGGLTRRDQEPKLFWLFASTFILISGAMIGYGALSALRV